MEQRLFFFFSFSFSLLLLVCFAGTCCVDEKRSVIVCNRGKVQRFFFFPFFLFFFPSRRNLFPRNHGIGLTDLDLKIRMYLEEVNKKSKKTQTKRGTKVDFHFFSLFDWFLACR
jgi:hypothetical protein